MKLTGAKDAALVLKALARSVEADQARKHMRKGAKVISDEAKGNASHTRGLGDSVGVVNNPDDPTGVYVTARRGKRYPKGYIAHIIEYGAAPHLIKPKASNKSGLLKLKGGALVPSVQHPGVTAKPFMRPAWDAKKNEAVRVIGASIKKDLTKK
jgi:HK97 gp10 family phage protein